MIFITIIQGIFENFKANRTYENGRRYEKKVTSEKIHVQNINVTKNNKIMGKNGILEENIPSS